MQSQAFDSLVLDWIAHYRNLESSDTPRLFPRWVEEKELLAGDPKRALAFVLAILARDESPRVLENLAAGPLEHILVKHGPVLIDLIDAEAQRNPAFRMLLGGVWRNDMTPAVWARLQSLVHERW